MAIKWVSAPPPFKNRRGLHLELAQLNAKPGRWGILREYKHSNSAFPSATRLRKRLADYEFTSRSVDGGSILYGRKLKR